MKFNITKKNRNIAVIVTIAAMVVLLAIIISLAFEFIIVENLVMGWVLTTFYSIFAFWMIGEPIKIAEIEKPVIQRVEVPVVKEMIREIEKPVEVIREIIREVETPVEVIREVPIQIPIENRIIELVEKPVIQRVEVPIIKTIEKKVYVKKPRKKLNIPKFNYVASSETKTFHKRNCRLGKLIKKKYKVHNNRASFFRKKHFKACKICVKK